MRTIGAADFETDPFKRGRLKLGPVCAGFYDGKLYRSWWGADCVKHLAKALRAFDGIVYFHNFGKFDYRFLLSEIDADAPAKAVKGRLASVKLGKCELRDSYLLLPVPLAAMEKEKFNYSKLEKDVREKFRGEILSYLRSDVLNLWRFVSDFIEQHGFGMTLAGRTFHILADKFDLKPPKFSERYDARMRRFYFGGRVEFRALGKLGGAWKVYDINSAYPRAMLEKHCFGRGMQYRTTMPRANAGRCFVHFVGVGGGAIPWRDGKGALQFPIAEEKEFFCTGWEFLAAKRAGVLKVREMREVLVPTECRDFRRYVEYFYRQKNAAKASGDRTAELFNKLLLNSLYGRFALNPREFKDVRFADFGDMSPAREGWELSRDFEDAGLSLWEKPATKRANSFFNVATAASITGWVRAFLWESLRASKGAVYCDTDSIICRDADALKVGGGLGEWKLEAEGGPLYIVGRKVYALRLARKYWKKDKRGRAVAWKTASKGVRMTAAEIVACSRGKPQRLTFDAPSYSLFSADRFITRRITRDDLRKK